MPRQNDIAALCLVAGIVLVTACNDSASTASVREEVKPPIALLPTSLPTPEPSPTEAHIDLPSHNYDERRGETYYYIAAISEEDRQRGVAVGAVSAFQYLGRNEAGEHILASMRSDGTVDYRAKCSATCKIIDTDYGRKIAYSPRSIIGAAFEDAFRGHLRVASWSRDVALPPAPDVAPPLDPQAATGTDEVTTFVEPEVAPQVTTPSLEAGDTAAPAMAGAGE